MRTLSVADLEAQTVLELPARELPWALVVVDLDTGDILSNNTTEVDANAAALDCNTIGGNVLSVDFGSQTTFCGLHQSAN